MFDILEVALKQDVETANKLMEERGTKLVRFRCARVQQVITVSREEGIPEARTNVYFSLSPGTITVTFQSDEKFSIVPSLKPDGNCKMMVGSEELEMWQVCRKALESLIFGTT